MSIVNAHFAAHSEKVKERNADYARITQSIISRAPIGWLKKDSPVLAARKLIAKAAKRALKSRNKKQNQFSFESILTAAGIPPDNKGKDIII